jgi:hypothetical protein
VQGEPDPESDSTPDSWKNEPLPDDASLVDRIKNVEWGYAVLAGVVAILPAFGAYVLIGIATDVVTFTIFPIGLVLFGYLLYQRPTPKTMLGGMSFWLAIEFFLAPVAMLLFTIVHASQVGPQTAAGQAGAALGGFLLIVVAFIVAVPIGVVLYLISNRLDVD